MAEKKPDYKVDFLPVVKEAMLRLSARAASVGIHEEYVRAMRSIIEQLRTRPLDWGDPEWTTRKAGGMICHGVVQPLHVRYVAFEKERSVCILKLEPMPQSPLE